MVDSNFDIVIDWDKERFSATELDIVERQGALFESCQNAFRVDAFDFIKKFMVSPVADELDKAKPELQEADVKNLGTALLNIAQVEPLGDPKYTEALYWIGYLYRYWAFMGTPSKDIIQVAPVEKAYTLYKGYHCLDVQEAIALLIERRG